MEIFKAFLTLVILYTCGLEIFSCSMITIFQRKVKTCPGVKNAGYIDLLHLEFVPLDDVVTAINGTLYINKKISSPWEVIISTDRYKYNNWEPGDVHRRVADFCLAIQNPTDIVYTTTKNFRNKRCPLLANVSLNIFWFIEFLMIWNSINRLKKCTTWSRWLIFKIYCLQRLLESGEVQ